MQCASTAADASGEALRLTVVSLPLSEVVGAARLPVVAPYPSQRCDCMLFAFGALKP